MPTSTPVNASGRLPVGNDHEIYWEQSGNPDGLPAVYLHGGPGGTLGPGGYRNKFDPGVFHIIGLDQRGCGRSRPLANSPGYDLAENTTAHLIGDLEARRKHLGVEQWVVNGVSWGSTLALAYAQEHPERVLGIVIMAVTSTSRFEVDWITETVGSIFPEGWDRLTSFAEEAGIGYRRGKQRLVSAYASLMQSLDAGVRDAASLAWADWEDTHIAIGAGGFHRDSRWDDQTFRHVFVTLTTHYWSQEAFLQPPILERMERLEGIPAVLIHGRQDISGPMVTAWELHRRWPGSELIIDEGEGHGGSSMVEEWTAGNSRMADLLRPV